MHSLGDQKGINTHLRQYIRALYIVSVPWHTQQTKFRSMEPSTAVCVSLFATKESTKLDFETAS